MAYHPGPTKGDRSAQGQITAGGDTTPSETSQETAQEQQQVQELERKTADYRNFETEVGEGRADEFNLGLGFIF